MIDKPSKLQPALLGGLVLGLGAVIPGLSYGNLCCCGWGIVGGVLAAHLLIRRSPVLPVKSGDGASVGALAGLVGSCIYLAIGVPLSLLQWHNVVSQVEQRAQSSAEPQGREAVLQVVSVMQSHPVLIALAIWVVFAIVGIGVASIGGMIGVAIFEKRKDNQYPPEGPPPGGYPPGDTPSAPPYGGPAPGQSPYGGQGPPTY